MHSTNYAWITHGLQPETSLQNEHNHMKSIESLNEWSLRDGPLEEVWDGDVRSCWAWWVFGFDTCWWALVLGICGRREKNGDADCWSPPLLRAVPLMLDICPVAILSRWTSSRSASLRAVTETKQSRSSSCNACAMNKEKIKIRLQSHEYN